MNNPLEDIELWNAYAALTDPDEAKQGAKLAADCLRIGVEMPDGMRDWLCEALEAISKGADPARALGTKRHRGAPERTERHRNMARRLAYLRVTGKSMSEACEQVAQAMHADERTLLRAWKEHGKREMWIVSGLHQMGWRPK